MYVMEPLPITDTSLISSNITENDHPVWSAATTYTVAYRVIKDHVIWQSVQGSNLNHDPVTDDGTWWVKVQATNRWRAFDGVISDPTTRVGGPITYSLQFDRTIDSIVFFELSAEDIDITITDPIDGVIYDATYSLASSDGEVIDAWTYFFTPITAQTLLTAEWLPGWAGCTIDISINSTGTTSVGEIFFGAREQIGETLVETSVGFKDYSIKSRDEFGNAFVVERDFAKIVGYRFAFPTYDIDRIMRLLTRLRATAAVYTGGAGTDQYSLAVAGFFQDFEVQLTHTTSFGTLEVESLV
jgi:hypothetical protein